MRYIIALDEGTTSAKAVIYDAEGGRIIASAGRGFSLTYPRSGWVETDAVQLWGAQYGALSEVLAESDVDLRDVYGIGVANQRETVVVWTEPRARLSTTRLFGNAEGLRISAQSFVRTKQRQGRFGKRPVLR